MDSTGNTPQPQLRPMSLSPEQQIAMQFAYPYAYIDGLPGYDQSEGVSAMLEVSRAVIDEGDDYYWFGVPFPVGANTSFTANNGAKATYTGSISLQPYTIIKGIRAYSDQTAGFKMNIYDKGSKTYLFDRVFSSERSVSSHQQLTTGNEYPGGDQPFGPYWATSILLVLPPGSLQCEITNLSANPATIQIMLDCNVPRNNISTGKVGPR